MDGVPSLDNFSAEQLKKMKEMQSFDEVMEFAAKEGVELTDEQIEAVSGGVGYWDAFYRALEQLW